MRKCHKDCKKENSNCPAMGLDGLPVQCVGPWVENKYFYLERYLAASREARRKYSRLDNAVFVDLFAGPGKCIIKGTDKEIENGAIRVLKREEAPFNENIFIDIDKENIESLVTRVKFIKTKLNYKFHIADSNMLVPRLVKDLLSHQFNRYHFIFADPFGPDGLKFNTIMELSKLKRVDILIHFPIMGIRRNWQQWLDKKNTILDEFLGTTEWRGSINSLTSDNILSKLIDIYITKLKKIGYVFDLGLKIVPIKNTRNAPLYDLIFVSKNKTAQRIWNSVLNIDKDGQKSFNF